MLTTACSDQQKVQRVFDWKQLYFQGIRILNYIDDRLIIAQLDVVAESILTTVARVKEGQSLIVKQFQRLLGLMEAASNEGLMEAVGVVPEGAQLIAAGLSTEVVETILQSRAPSTRKLFALKWRRMCLHYRELFSESVKKMFLKLVLFCLCFWLLEGVRSVSVLEGDSVTLNSGLTELNDDRVHWWFINETIFIAEHNVPEGRFNVYDDVLDGRFRGRLKLDYPTGSLTITNTTPEHTGCFELEINTYSRPPLCLVVYAHLSVPVISRNCSSSSSSSCSLLCSVVNVGHVTLSWYKGNSLLSSISVSDLSISLSLPLEVEYQDKNIYSCVNSEHCCGFTEAVIRLVLSALVGVATVTILVYDIRSRRAHHIHKSGT
ncbi:uncharacterized protein LOC122328146 [Puntigrus tetrazona]|uniref:uncharacterized protein LOC122328146 n=1 Tax=Puntigrus tetrazona TaxID=1606681 RepID=UPI001C890D91|nr:uncharacterized protein LOC122328146 [Puntigrus tetrazona]